jgi:hypothetical protein
LTIGSDGFSPVFSRNSPHYSQKRDKDMAAAKKLYDAAGLTLERFKQLFKTVV